MNYTSALAYFPKLTPLRARRLREFFSPLETYAEAEFSELVAAGLEAPLAHELITWREKLDLPRMAAELAKLGITIIPWDAPTYPALLAQIPDPPPALFVRGKLPAETLPHIAVVGTRRCSPYGKLVTEQITAPLARAGVVIVSGLAFGIDGVAHSTTIKAGGLTVAVLGSGIDQATIHPHAHGPLAEEIIAHGGAVVSEYPPGFPPTQYSFPARNRIIAGLTHGTLVTEAPLKSGALITARAALDYNREVFAVPHALTNEMGAGGNALLKQGAVFVTEANDILDALALPRLAATSTSTAHLPPTEQALIALLSAEPQPIDTIIKRSGLPSQAVTSTLLILEIKGHIKNIGGMQYVRQ